MRTFIAMIVAATLLSGCISHRPITVDASDHFIIVGNKACFDLQLNERNK